MASSANSPFSPLSAFTAAPRITGTLSPGNWYFESSSRTSSSTRSSSSTRRLHHHDPGEDPCDEQYLADGSLLFKDVCTSEFAVATPEQLQAEANGLKPPQ